MRVLNNQKTKRGSWFLVRKILISVKHPILSNQLTELLKKLDYTPYQLGDQIRLTKKEDLERFQKEIGFIERSKISAHSKFLDGFEKNTVLKMAIDSYKNPKALLDFLIKKRPSSRLNWD